MNYMSAREAANKWGITQRRVATLCSENRIENAMMIGNMWIIPDNTEKPEDARSVRFKENSKKTIKPFLKWAGGKSQLLKDIQEYYPFNDESIIKYAEPFVGGGAVLFDILSRFDLKEVYISDCNKELINTYIVIRDKVDELIDKLSIMQQEFLDLNQEGRKDYYLDSRERFNYLINNSLSNEDIEKAAHMIFLNKTCFNGLFRVNKKGQFNVPMGVYKNPLICDKDNLYAISNKLKIVTIINGDYKKSEEFIDDKTFVYFDPPYRPLNKTQSFTSYTENGFSDEDQIELSNFVNKLDKKGAKILVSNSDPKNTDINDNFFDDIYAEYNIKRISASRMINSKGNARGKINELLISNF